MDNVQLYKGFDRSISAVDNGRFHQNTKVNVKARGRYLKDPENSCGA